MRLSNEHKRITWLIIYSGSWFTWKLIWTFILQFRISFLISVAQEPSGMERSCRRILHTVECSKLFGDTDCRHVEVKKATNSGSFYYCYVNTFSIVLLAAVNSNLEFILVGGGVSGRVLDGWSMKHETFRKLLRENSLHIPEPENLPSSTRKLYFVFFVRLGIYGLSRSV